MGIKSERKLKGGTDEKCIAVFPASTRTRQLGFRFHLFEKHALSRCKERRLFPLCFLIQLRCVHTTATTYGEKKGFEGRGGAARWKQWRFSRGVRENDFFALLFSSSPFFSFFSLLSSRRPLLDTCRRLFPPPPLFPIETNREFFLNIGSIVTH